MAPLWLRLAYTAWIAVWIPAYWRQYGPSAFLWFCDLGNLQILAGLWTGRALFYSWAAVSVLLVQLLWVTDVLGRLTMWLPPCAHTFEATADGYLTMYSLAVCPRNEFRR